MFRIFVVFFFCFLMPSAFAQVKVIPLYPLHSIPLSQPCLHQEIIDTTKTGLPDRISKVSEPRIWLYPAKKKEDRGKKALLVLPGGGYSFVSVENEGRKMGERFSKAGYDVVVLIYRLPVSDCQTDSKWVPLTDAMNALQWIWNQKYAKVGLIGFSAGGHLAASLSTLMEKNPHRPSLPQVNAACLVYPVIDFETYTHTMSRKKLLGADTSSAGFLREFSLQHQVNAKTPPSVLIHSADDKTVPWQNSLLYTEALQKAGVKAEFHLYPSGGHGFGLGKSERDDAPDWVPLALQFFKKML
jgi:acetyl esterase/lipase